MKKLFKKRAFLALISFFTLNLVATACFAMEEKASQPQRRSPLSLTQLAADAYIKGFKKEGTFNEQSALEIKQELNEKYPNSVSEIEEIINLRLSQNNVFTQQYLGEKIIAVLPDSNQIVTKENLYNNAVSFWKIYSPNNKRNGLLQGALESVPGAINNFGLRLASKKDSWQKTYTLKMPENFNVLYINETIILCSVIDESENDDQLFDSKKIALFVKSKNNFKMKQIIKMENSIIDCAFLAHENLLALALKNNTIVMFRYDKLSKTWQQAETIKEAASKDFNIEKIAFLNQAYKENPLIFIHSVQSDNDDIHALSYSTFNKNNWQNPENILTSDYIKLRKSPDSTSITLQYTDKENSMTMLIEECKDREQLYTAKNFTKHRHFSHDRTLSVHQNHRGVSEIIELATGNTIKSIKGNYYYLPVFINNNMMAISWGNGAEIIELRQSIDFALCTKVLEESEKEENVDLNAFIQSPLINQLSYQEKKLVIQKAHALKTTQSLKGKIDRLRRECSTWSYRNPDLYRISMIATALGVYSTGIYVHGKIDPSLSYWGSLFNNKIVAGISAGTMHGIIAIGLTNRLSNYIFPK